MQTEDFNREVKIVDRLCRRVVFKTDNPLSDEDQLTLRDLVYYLRFLLVDILPDSAKASRLFGAFFGLGIDLIRFSDTLAGCEEYLKVHLITAINAGESVTFSTFKQWIKEHGLYVGYANIVEELFDEFCLTNSATSYRSLLHWFCFPARINLRSIDYKSKELEAYISYEEELKCRSYPADLIREVNLVLREWLQGFSFSGFTGKHGPGSVAGYKGRLSPLIKYQIMTTDQLLEYFYKKYVGGEFNSYVPCNFVGRLERTSELVFVPKSLKRNRTISKEPTSLQFSQQGIAACLDDYFLSHPDLRHRIALHRQDLSMDLARRASLFGDLSTIDLSSASDSVTYQLVKQVFRGTLLLPALMATRSTHTRVDKLIIPLAKFAPMGSAVCFPVESLLFAALCEVAVRRTRCRSEYRVYGDDIIIESSLSRSLIEILNSLGFSVNERKSFCDVGILNFRESCGGEYLNYSDVTPMRISRKYRSVGNEITNHHPEVIQNMIAFANDAFNRGLWTLRRAINAVFNNRYKDYHRLERSLNDPSKLLTMEHVDVNYNLQKRFQLSGYQRLEVQAFGLESCDNVDLLRSAIKNIKSFFLTSEDKIRYFEWLRSRYSNPDLEIRDRDVAIRPRVPVMKLKWKYT